MTGPLECLSHLPDSCGRFAHLKTKFIDQKKHLPFTESFLFLFFWGGLFV